MANTYYKILNESIKTRYQNDILASVQDEIKNAPEFRNLNIYDLINQEENKTSLKNLDTNFLLKYYLLNQILKTSNENTPKNNIQKRIYEDTANSNIKFNIEDKKYYRLKNNELVLDETIETVNNDGTYITITRKITSSYKIKKTISAEDCVLSIQLIRPDNKIESNKFQAAEILEMKKEFVQKFKYSGVSGDSKDFIASLLNKLNSPLETGNYMDKSYNLYKWSEINKCFIRNLLEESKSPLLTDYEFTNKIVVRKDFTGICK